MEHVLLFSLLLLFSTGLCAGNDADLGTTTSELAAMKEKMEAMSQAQRSLTDSLKDTVQQLATVQAKLQASSELVQDLQRDVQDLKTENQGLKTENQTLKDIVATRRATVAFSASLGTSMGPFERSMPVKYSRVWSNVGSGYNPATGSFTAPLRGVYYFIYTMFNRNSGTTRSVLSLMKNGQQMVATWDTAPGDYNNSATNTVVVQLEAGDSVCVWLWADRQIYDDSGNYNSFAGFLLFTV